MRFWEENPQSGPDEQHEEDEKEVSVPGYGLDSDNATVD